MSQVLGSFTRPAISTVHGEGSNLSTYFQTSLLVENS